MRCPAGDEIVELLLAEPLESDTQLDRHINACPYCQETLDRRWAEDAQALRKEFYELTGVSIDRVLRLMSDRY